MTFLFPKSQTLYVTWFSWKCWNWHSYTKSMTLCVTWIFYIPKGSHFSKARQFAISFLIYKSLTLCVTQIFLECLKLKEGRGIFIKQKKTLRYILIRKKMCSALHFFFVKARHYAVQYRFELSIVYLFLVDSSSPYISLVSVPLIDTGVAIMSHHRNKHISVSRVSLL